MPPVQWLGIPALLDVLYQEKRGKLRKRNQVRIVCRGLAEEILAQWKSSLLADFRTSPHRYCFTGTTTSRLRFVENTGNEFEKKVSVVSHSETTGAPGGECHPQVCHSFPLNPALLELNSMHEEEDWQRILGKGDIDRWALGLKGPTWLPMRDWGQSTSSLVEAL